MSFNVNHTSIMMIMLSSPSQKLSTIWSLRSGKAVSVMLTSSSTASSPRTYSPSTEMLSQSSAMYCLMYLSTVAGSSRRHGHTSVIGPLQELTSVHIPDPVGALHHKLGAVQLPWPSLPPPALEQAAVVEAGLLGTLGLDCLLETTSGMEGRNHGEIWDHSLRFLLSGIKLI